MSRRRLTILSCLLCAGLFAQKPTAGTVTSEVAVNGALGNLNLSLVQGARFRYFFSDNLAVRLGVGIDALSRRVEVYERPDGTGGTGEVRANFFEFALLPGAELHFKGGERLSTFAGAYILFGLATARTEQENVDPNLQYASNFSVTVKGRATFLEGNQEIEKDGGTSFGVGLYSGFDWYFTEKVFLGIEWGVLFRSRTASEVETEITAAGTTTRLKEGPRGETSIARLIPSGGIRLGYQF